MAKQRRDQVSIHFEERADKPTFAVTGAHGGITADGRCVVAHVYAEWAMLPSLEQIPIKPSGETGTPKTIRRGDVNREVQATLVMTPEAALEFGRWLLQRGDAAYNQREKAGRPVKIETEVDKDADG